MNKKMTYIIWFTLFVITFCSLFFVFNKQKVVITSNQIFGGTNFFMNNVSQCPKNVSVSEQFSCLYILANATEKEADTLAKKIISQSPVRLEEINKKNIGTVPFVYGGTDFLTALPIQVKKAQQVKDEYINSICNLTSMTIYGGSGMDLEQNACKYYFTSQYLQILKSLEGGLTATSSDVSDIYGGYDNYVSSIPKNDDRNYEKEFYCPFKDNVSNTECLVNNLDKLSAIREWKQIKLENLKSPEINPEKFFDLAGDINKIKKWRENFETARDLKCGASAIFHYGSGSPGAVASCDIDEEISALKILDNDYYVMIMSYNDGSKGIPDFEPTEQDILKLMKSNKTTRENCCGIW